jgi:hypothetical protein
LLGMCALLSLLEAVDTLHVFAQEEKIFVSDFVATLKMTEGQLISLYVDKGPTLAQTNSGPSEVSWIARKSRSIGNGLRTSTTVRASSWSSLWVTRKFGPNMIGCL